MEYNGTNRWVEDRMKKLGPEEDWQPDTARGLARLEERRGGRIRRVRRWTGVVAVGAAAGLSLMAFPSPRAYAQRYVAACSGEAMHICDLLQSRDFHIAVHRHLLGLWQAFFPATLAKVD